MVPRFRPITRTFISGLTVVIGCLLIGCHGAPMSLREPDFEVERHEYLALGDSYTIGAGVDETHRWPVVLARKLSLPPPTIVAQTAWSTNQLRTATAQADLPKDFGMVTVMVGVNDEFRGRSLEMFRRDLDAYFEEVLTYAAGDASRVTVISIPDYGVTPFGRSRGGGTSERIDRFNEVARDVASRHRFHWIDVTDISRAMPDSVIGDGLHPDPEQLSAWADRIATELPDPANR